MTDPGVDLSAAIRHALRAEFVWLIQDAPRRVSSDWPILNAARSLSPSPRICHAARDKSMAADYVFTVIEGWGLPKDKMSKFEEIIDRYGSVGASPYKIDTASFMLETRYGVWGVQVPLKFKAPSKKRRTFAAPVTLVFMDGVEGRFAGLLPARHEGGGNLH